MTNQIEERGIEERIRAAFDAADDLVVEPSPTLSPVRRPVTPRRGALVALASATVVLIVVGGVSMLRSDVPADGRTGSTEVATSVVAPTTTTAVLASGTHATFQVVDAEAGGGHAIPRAVTASGDGFVALIEDPTGVWTWGSPDGLEWMRLGLLPVGSESGSPLFAGPADVVQYNGELIAAGTIHGQTARGENLQIAAIWRSPDGGATWSLETAGPGFIGSIVDTDDGPVAGGAIVRGPGSRAAVWRLADSTEPIDLASAVDSDAVVSFVRALTDSDRGLIAYVTTGTIAEADKADRVAAWVSEDGSSWIVADEPQPLGHGPMGVLRTPAGYFAQGYEAGSRDSSFNLWSSPNGLTWTPVDLGAESYEVVGLAYAGELFAIGTTQTFEDGVLGAFWSSNGGIVWDMVRPEDTESEPWVVGASGGRIVVLGANRMQNGAVTAWIID